MDFFEKFTGVHELTVSKAKSTCLQRSAGYWIIIQFSEVRSNSRDLFRCMGPSHHNHSNPTIANLLQQPHCNYHTLHQLGLCALHECWTMNVEQENRRKAQTNLVSFCVNSLCFHHTHISLLLFLEWLPFIGERMTGGFSPLSWKHQKKLISGVSE